MQRRRFVRFFSFSLFLFFSFSYLYSFTFQMFHLAKNVRSSQHAWVPVLQRCFSAVALSDHKQIRTKECQNGEKVGNYSKLLSNCSEYCLNNSANIRRYCTVNWTVKNLFAVQVGACTQSCHSLPSFIDKFIDYSSWIINLLLDVLVCSIALYFYSLFVY